MRTTASSATTVGSKRDCVRCVDSNANHTARVIMRGHVLMQNLRRGHYELGIDARAHRQVETAFTELARTI